MKTAYMLRIDPSGKKYWILRYSENKKARQLSLGAYPAVSLKEARMKRDKIQFERAQGKSPSQNKNPKTFSGVAAEWLKIRMSDKADSYLETVNLRLKKYVFPEIGDKPIQEIRPRDILYICRKIEDLGFSETAARVRALIGQVFRFAVAEDLAEFDPTAALIGALKSRQSRHYPTFTEEKDITVLMRSIKNYPYKIMRLAMLFSIYTAARPGEIRAAEWTEIKPVEIDGVKSLVWDIPAGKMKMKRRHIVPLSRQALKVIEELRPITGNSKYLFPSPRSNTRCMSENGVRIALRSIGFTKEQIVPHGFRATFSTIANEHGFNRDVIERQLAHVEGNAVRGAYNHAEYLAQRKDLMQWWADWLDNLT